MSQPLIATCDQQRGHRVINLRHQWHSHWLKNQSDISAHLPRTPSCCRDAPGDKANLIRYGNVQFDSNLCVVKSHVKTLDVRINKGGQGWPIFKKS